MLVSGGHVHTSCSDITKVSINCCANWVLCRVGNHSMYHTSLWDNKAAQIYNLLSPCIMENVRQLNSASSKECLWSMQACSSTDMQQINTRTALCCEHVCACGCVMVSLHGKELLSYIVRYNRNAVMLVSHKAFSSKCCKCLLKPVKTRAIVMSSEINIMRLCLVPLGLRLHNQEWELTQQIPHSGEKTQTYTTVPFKTRPC